MKPVDALEEVEHHGLVGAHELKEVGELDLVLGVLLHHVLLLDHKPADQGDDKGDGHGYQGQDHVGGLVAAGDSLDGDGDGGHGRAEHAQDHDPETGSDQQQTTVLVADSYNLVLESSLDVIHTITV